MKVRDWGQVTLAFLVTLCIVGMGYAGIYTTTDISDTEVVTATDTNRVSGTISVSGLQDELRSQTKYNGVFAEVYSGSVINDSDAAFGTIDTTIVTIYTKLFNTKQNLLVDTLAAPPGTSSVWITADTMIDLLDFIYIDYYCADSTSDYSQTGQITSCTLKYNIRFWEE